MAQADARHSKLPAAALWRAVVLLFLVVPAAAFAQTPRDDYSPGELLIKFVPGTPAAQIDSILGSLGASRVAEFRSIGASQQRISRMTVEQAVARFRGDPRIRYIEPNFVVHASRAPNDPSLAQEWAMHNTGQTGGTAGADIDALRAWDITTGSASVLVAIIDSGIDYTHTDLAPNIFFNTAEIPNNHIDDDGNGFVDDVRGWDFVNGDNDPMDDNGHGTHVAGTVGAVGNNGIGVAGVSWNVRLLPVKFLNSSGAGNVANAISAIEYATRMGARIMNNSWGGGPYSQALFDAIRAAGDAGALFVAAAGNESSDNDLTPSYPAGYVLPNVISVAATDANDQLATFSNYGATTVDLAAPGVDILSTARRGGYILLSGTSMATPHVSGTLALILSRFPDIDPASAKSLLLSHVQPVPALTGRVASGGRLSAYLPLASPDSLPPAPIADLTLTRADGQWAEFQWYATGDDGSAGTAARYELRFSIAPITPATFRTATAATGLPHPLPAGSTEHVRVVGLQFSTAYYFAVEARDEYGNASLLSNVVTGVTLAPPLASLTSASLDADLFTGQTATRTLTVGNTGPSELAFQLSEQPQIVPLARAGRTIAPAGPVGARAATDVTAAPRYHAGRSPALAAPPKLQPLVAAPVPRIGYRVLMITSGGTLGPLRDLLAQFPDLVQLDVMDAQLASPTLDQLKAYQAVMVSDGTPFSDPVQLGNVLADYADWGGGVILGVASFIHNWEIRGRLLTGGYMPFQIGTGPGASGTLGVYDALHPIMNGVTSVSGDLLGQVALASGAQLVASWDNGQPFVATRGAHVVAVNLYYDFPGYWTGDAPLLLHNAIAWAGGAARILSFYPAAGVVAPGGSASVQVTLDAARLYGGHYASDAVLQSNDPGQPRLALRANLNVTGAADIAVSPNALDFGQVFTGYSLAETVMVSNVGTDVLTVGSLSATSPFVHLSQSAFSLGPGQRDTLLVTFAPSAPGPLSATLGVASNDPDTPLIAVPLTGSSLVPPVLAVSPATLDAALNTGQSSSDLIEVRNTGGSDLVYTLGWRPVIGGAVGAQAARISPTATVTAIGASPGGVRAPAGAGHAIATSGDPPRGVASPVTTAATHDILVLTTVDVSGTIVAGLNQLGRGFDLVTTDDFTTIDFTPYRTVIVGMDGGSIDEQDCRALANAAAAGRLVFMLGGSNYPPYYLGLQQYLLSHTGQQGWVSSGYPQLKVVAPGDPLATGLPSSTSFSNFAASYYSVRISDPQAPAVAVNGDQHPILVHKPIGAGTLVYFTGPPDFWYWEASPDSAIFRQILVNALKFETPQWLAVTPQAGTLAPGASQTLNVTFDATARIGGGYDAEVVLNTNDPTQRTLGIPTHLKVTGIPRLALSATHLDFGQVYVSVARIETLLVSNPGTDVLSVSSIVATPDDYAPGVALLSLVPGETRQMLVTFSPHSAAVIPGTLELHTNDPDQPVLQIPLSGEGLPPPVIGIAPASLTFTVATGAPATQTLTLSNTGGSPLGYQIAVRAAGGTSAAQPAPATRALPAPASGPGRMTGAPAPPLPISPAAAADRFPPAGGGAGAVRPAGREPLTLAVRRTTQRSAGTVLVIADGGTESDVASVLTGAGYTVTIGPDDAAWDGTNPSPDGFAAVVLLDGPNFGSDMPDSGQVALLNYVAHGGGLIFTEWVTYEIEQGRYQTLRPLVPMTRLTGNSGSFLYHVIKAHPVTAGVTSKFYVESGLTGGLAGSGTALVVMSDGEAVVLVSDYALGHVVEFGMAGNWGGYRPLAVPDMQRLMVNAADWVAAGSWLTAAPASGTLPAGSIQNVQVTAEPGRLLGGDYAAELEISSSDPAHPSVSVPASMHVTGAPDLALSSARLDFGGVYLSTTKAETLIVMNRGTTPLNVSAVHVSPAQYDAPGAAFALAPGAVQELEVSFTPSGGGEQDGSIEIDSDDPDSPLVTVPLTGAGLAPPQMTLTPPALSASLLAGGQATQSLTIANAGGSDLHFSVRTAAAPSGALQADRGPAKGQADLRRGRPVVTAAGGPDNFGYRWKDSGDPSGPKYGWVEIASVGTAIPLSGDDWNYGPVPIGFDFPFYGVKYGSLRVCSNGWLSPSSTSTQFVIESLPNVFAPENLLAAYWADLTTAPASVFYYNDGTRLIVEYQNVRYSGRATYFTFETLLYPDGRIVYQYRSVGDTSTSACIGLQNATRDDGLQVAFNTPYAHDQLAISLAPGPSWLSVSPAESTVAAGAQLPLAVRFDAAGIGPGDYSGRLIVASNDPNDSAQDVPIDLHVTGAPSLALTPGRLDFGPIFLGAAVAETLTASNAGSMALDVGLIELTNPVFSAPTAAFSLPPGGSLRIPVTFTPAALGPSDGSITFHSDDPTHPAIVIALHGQADPAPIAVLSPGLLQDLLGPGEVHTASLRLDNRGGSPLIWSARALGLLAPGTVLANEPVGGSTRAWNAAALAAALAAGRATAPRAAAGDSMPGPASLADVLALLDARYAGVTAAIPNRFDFSEGQSGVSIVDGGENMYETGNLLSTDLASSIAYSDGVIAPGAAFAAPYFTRKYPGLFVLAADVAGPTSFMVSGMLGAAGAGSADGAVLVLDFGSLTYIGVVKRVSGAGVPSVNHLTILVNPRSVLHSFASDTHLDQESVTGLGATRRFYYLLFAGAGGAYIPNAQMNEILLRFAIAVTPSPPWLGISPAAGTVPPLGYQELTASLDSRLIGPGEYFGNLLFDSNDPEAPHFVLPVSLSVGSSPTATDVALVSATVSGGAVHVLWKSSAPSLRATVQRAVRIDGWQDVAALDADGLGYLRFDDADVVPGTTYGYRLSIPDAGGARTVGETWITAPASAPFALFGLQPNPAVREVRVAFSLPDDRPATLELLDLAGRRVRFQAVGSNGPGRHVISLGPTGSLPSGVYLVRLERDGRRFVSKCVVMQ
jgi:subtilisin family serine protease